MSYNKRVWANGDLITKEKINHMEDGIYDAHDKINAIDNELSSQIKDIANSRDSEKINVLCPPNGMMPLKRFNKIDEVTIDDGIYNLDKLKIIINYCENNYNNSIIYFPQGIYPLIPTIKINKALRIIGESGHAQHLGGDSGLSFNGTMLYDVSDIENSDLFMQVGTFVDIDKPSKNRVWGFSMEGIRIQGNSQKHDVINLIKTGWDSIIRNVFIAKFKGCGIKAYCCYDTNLDGVTIADCGSDIDGVKYSLELDSGQNDCTNAWHFDSLHLEGSRYLMKLNKCRHITFVNSKFEQNEATCNNDNTNAPIYLSQDVGEISFIGSMFIPISIDHWRTKINDVSFIPPHFILLENIRHNSFTAITSSHFASPDAKGSKLIKSNNGCAIISNNILSTCSGSVYGIELIGEKNELVNNKICCIREGDINLPIYIENALCKENYITNNINSIDTINEEYAISVRNNTYSKIIDNRTNEFKYYTKILKINASDDNAKVQIKRNLDVFYLNDSSLANLGITDLTNITLDMSKINSNYICIQTCSSDLCIKGIENAVIGEEITLFCNTYNINVKLSDDGSSPNKILLNNSSTDSPRTLTLRGNDMVLLKHIGFMWREISRCVFNNS